MKTRRLSGNWSVSDVKSQSMHGLDVEAELMAALSTEIKHEIDWSIFQKLYTNAGWYSIELASRDKVSTCIRSWVEENCSDSYVCNHNGTMWLFRSNSDFTLFSLRWA